MAIRLLLREGATASGTSIGVSRPTKQQKELTNYTKLNAFARYPAWSPLGNQIVYEYNETTGNIWLIELK